MSKNYDHQKVEKKWQQEWEKRKTFSPNLRTAKKPFFNLMMFPYPSAEGLHVGNMYAFTGADVYGRFMRMRGFDVFEPIGLDGFGIHSENYALSVKEHPAKLAKKTEKKFYEQLHATGNSYAWQNTLETYHPDYYKWTQWIFVQMFKAGLAYRARASVNWCPSCKTVLADEQVINGKCERCSAEVEMKDLEQWFFRTSTGKRPDGRRYPDSLLANLDKIDWSKRVVVAQKNWIGRSEGATVRFPIFGSRSFIKVFTTRPDTLYGATFLVLSPNSKWVKKLTTQEHKQKVSEYIKSAHRLPEKTGVFTGGYVLNPATGKKIPVYVADYVLTDYGTGAIMGVPAHDQRDWDFAKANNLPIIEVVSGGNISKQAYEGGGKLVNSGGWNGWKMPDELDRVVKDLKKQGWGEATTSYHLRDWLISRQRYWGPPIPMIYCEKCAREGKSWFTTQSPDGLDFPRGFAARKSRSAPLHGDQSDWKHAGWYPVDEKELPVKLPYIKDYRPKGTGVSPLATKKDFYEVDCPACGQKARRETDVSDTFLDSSWYFLRYPSVGLDSQAATRSLPWDPEVTKKWLPVDMYIGGAEHSVLHLLYSRWITMVFKDLGLINFEEPFERFYAHGLIIKDGAKMSKSKGNVVIPDDYIRKYGADTLRAYLMFLGPFDAGGDFRDTGIEGMRRFIERVWRLFNEHGGVILAEEKDARDVLIKMHQTIKKVTEDIQNLRYNTAIAAMMEFVNLLYEKTQNSVTSSSLLRSKLASREAADDQNSSDSQPGHSAALQKNPSRSTALHRSGAGKIRCAEWDEALRNLAKLLAPFAPHMTEEIWVNLLGEEFSIHTSSWPKYDADLTKETQIVVVIQVDGKVRGQLTLESSRARDKKEVIELARKDSKIQKWLKKKKIKKVIFVPEKIVNFVTK